jgi:hypothetical protein
MPSDKPACFRCGEGLNPRPGAPAAEPLDPSGRFKTVRVVCPVCGAVNLIQLPAEGGKK